MSKTRIEWTDVTWNPVTGCDHVSPGCDHCYAMSLAPRLKAMGAKKYQRDGDPRTSGPGFGVTLHPDALQQPLSWKAPRRVFVNSMSDLFHAEIPDEFIARVYAVMSLTSQHTYQVLTKRHGRMRSLLSSDGFRRQMYDALVALDYAWINDNRLTWPLPNVWLGVSVEDQKRAHMRIPALLQTPAAVRFLSMEPLLGPVNLTHMDVERHAPGMYQINALTGRNTDMARPCRDVERIDWVIVGGESGPQHRAMDPAWVRSLRDQCQSTGTPFFFKQWGGRTPKANGDHLDGREWSQYPRVVS